MPTISPRSRSETLFGLEILRFVAALAVVIYHYPDYFVFDGAAPRPLAWMLWPLYEYGQFAVPTFWALSGYVFFWKYEKPIAGRTISARQFGVLRFSRLYPLHLATLALVSALYLFSDNAWWPYAMGGRDLVAQLLFASNWFTLRDSFNGPIWSVSIEVLVYAAFFVATRAWRLDRPVPLPAIVAVSGLGYWAVAHLGGPRVAALQIAACSVCFFSGAWLARWRDAAQALYPVIAPVAVLSAAALFVIRPTYALTFALPIAAVFVFSAGPVWRTKAARRLAAAGDLTYGSYLLHFPIAAALRLTGIGPMARSPIVLCCYIALVFGAAAASLRWLERPA